MSTRRNERGKLWVGASVGFRKREVGGKGKRGCVCGCVCVCVGNEHGTTTRSNVDCSHFLGGKAHVLELL